MSALLMGRVFYLDLPQHQKMLLLALADHADDEGKNCYPSVELLARKASVSERRVQQIRAELVAQGIVTMHVQAAAGSRGQIPQGKRPNDYELHIPDHTPRGAMGFTPGKSAPKPASGVGVKPASPQGCNGLHPEPSIDPSKEPSAASSPPATPRKASSKPVSWSTEWAKITRLARNYGELARVIQDPDQTMLTEQGRQAALAVRMTIKTDTTESAKWAFRDAYQEQAA